VLGVLTVTGCGSAQAGKPLPLVRVTERDFHITVPKHVHPGTVRLRLQNRGPDTHELLVVRADGRPLPLRRDDLTVDEDTLKKRDVATIEGVERGRWHDERVVLAQGRYVLFCNMAGHYLAGMHAALVVR
jgi:uncharacterized cupredoxin-like copper-binding protein